MCKPKKFYIIGRKQPSVVNDNNKKEVQERKFNSDDSHDEVTDMMKGTPKVSILM